MESWSAKESKSGFGLDDVDFSNRVLCLEIAPALPPNAISEFGATDLNVKKIHISTLTLASKSQFFYKLFKNGMRETEQRDEVVLKIDASEEAAFMDLLKFIYGYSLNATSSVELVDLLMVADKFEVPSCTRYCVGLLHKLPMSKELALIYLELPPSLMADQVVQTLIKSAKKYICAHFKDFAKSQEEAMGLPLCAVEIVIGSDDLEVVLQDVVFDFVLKWGRLHYPDLEERREILTRLLVSYICLPKMSPLKLKEVIDCADIDSEKVWKLVLDAIFAKYPTVEPTVLEYEYEYDDDDDDDDDDGGDDDDDENENENDDDDDDDDDEDEDEVEDVVMNEEEEEIPNYARMLLQKVDAMHQKVDELHQKMDAMHKKVDAMHQGTVALGQFLIADRARMETHFERFDSHPHQKKRRDSTPGR